MYTRALLRPLLARPIVPLQRMVLPAVRYGSTFPQPTQAADSFRTETPVEEHIINDHRSFEELYDRFKANEGNTEEQSAIINELVREVAQHSIAEETVVYPALEQTNAFGAGESIADHLRQEHYQVKKLLYKLDSMEVTDPGFNSTLSQVMDTLKEHAEEEESKELPELKKLLSKEERIGLSKSFLRRKAISPTRPHPGAPDKPPSLEVAAGLPVAPIDKLKDQARNFAERRVPQ